MIFKRPRTGSCYHIRFTMFQSELKGKANEMVVEQNLKYEITKRDFVCQWVVSVDI